MQEVEASFAAFAGQFPTGGDDGVTETLRILKLHREHAYWKEVITVRAEKLKQAITEYTLDAEGVLKEIEKLVSQAIGEHLKGLFLDIKAYFVRLSALKARLEKFFTTSLEQTVCWIEVIKKRSQFEVRLQVSELDISAHLRDALFEKMSTTILCSATLTSKKNFQYVKDRLGIQKEDAFSEQCYDSPFLYEKQALLGVPQDLPFPDQPDFIETISQAIPKLIATSRGNALVLFTSYSMLRACAEAVEEKLQEQNFPLLKQGDDHRFRLLERFKNEDRSVLFGADSFWEGIDVIGDALRLVIIVKLPFLVPSDPLYQARSERTVQQGKSPFIEHAIPKAVMKFKQAFGRLIRHKDDRGCVVCLDTRLLKKQYGHFFLKSLPKCQEVFAPLGDLCEQMKTFYSKKKS